MRFGRFSRLGRLDAIWTSRISTSSDLRSNIPVTPRTDQLGVNAIYHANLERMRALDKKGMDALGFFEANDQKELEAWIKEGKISVDLTARQFRTALKMHRKNLSWPKHFEPTDLTEIPKKGPVKHLTVALRKKGGRNNTGRITVRHRGGGFKRRIRLLDWNRARNTGAAQKVVRLEHDPGRSCHKIALLQNIETKELSYILPPAGLEPGMVLQNDKSQVPGHTLPLEFIPIGTEIYNIELKPGKGGKLVRSAGNHARIIGHDDKQTCAIIELPSKKTKHVSLQCTASIGRVACADHMFEKIGSAGRNRRLGWRPTVRGVAMNPVDHPHGGGKGGRSKGHHSQSPWGKICK